LLQPISASPGSLPALDIPGRDPGAVEGLVDTTLGCHAVDERPHKGHQRLVMLPHLAMVLLPEGQLRKGRAQVALRLAVKATLTAKPLPWSKDGQGDRLTPTEGRLGSRVLLRRQGGLAKVINHDVKKSEEGVGIDHRAAPYLGEDRAMLPVGDTFCSPISCQPTPSV